MELQTGQYMGDIPFTMAVGGIVLATSRHSPRTSIPLHYHVNPHFTYVLEGSYEEIHGGRRRHYQQGDLLFHPTQAEHRNEFEQQPVACFNVEIELNCLPLGTALHGAKAYQAVASPQLKGLVRNIIREASQPDCFSETIAFGYAVQLAGGFLRNQHPSVPASGAIRRVQTYLNDVPQHTPTLLELAEVAGLSPDYLCRDFKRVTGLTPGEYLRHQKVNQVCGLLARPELSTEEIAFQVGFADASHLCRVFKKVMGMTPSAYQKAL